MVRRTVTLDDKYTEQSGQIYLNGLQALVRLPIIQQQLDNKSELNTSFFISGYRGEPLTGLDIEFTNISKLWEQYNLVFQPAVNEKLAATAVWGSQQLYLNKQKQYDGVTGIWYGNGAEVNNSLEAMKNANAAGTSPNGGVLVLAGDDTEQALIHAMIPIISPSGISDVLTLGLHAIAISRFSGCWVAIKTISDMTNSSASIFTDSFNIDFKIPSEFELPDGGLNIRENDNHIEQEKRLLDYKLPAVQEYTRINKLDYTVFAPKKKMHLGIVTTGKSYMDILQAFAEMGLSQEDAVNMGIGLYKVSVVWPLEQIGIQEFAHDAEEILVIEEKRGLIENQLKEAFYHMPPDKRPRICGKTDTIGEPLLSASHELSPTIILKTIISRFNYPKKKTDEFNKVIEDLDAAYDLKLDIPKIGLNTNISTIMSGKGMSWIGQAPFTNDEHVFANLDYATYFHSGVLTIRAALIANINITYKIFYSDVMAIIDGTISVDMMARQLAAEGVKEIIVMSNNINKYKRNTDFPSFTNIEHCDDLEYVQKNLRKVKGVSVLIYDETCAVEKHRKKKLELSDNLIKRVIINERLCEGCGDCDIQSNCLSVITLETEFGRKRMIEQFSWKHDFSSINGFCPSFVTVYGGKLKKPKIDNVNMDSVFDDLPKPDLPSLEKPIALLITGLGGIGVTTISKILAMAAHLDDKAVTTMEEKSLRKKNDVVISNVRIARHSKDIFTVRINAASANVIIGCDLLATAGGDVLSRIKRKKTKLVLNTNQSSTAKIVEKIINVSGVENLQFLDATSLVTELLGDKIFTNMFMLGYAWQIGLIPVSQGAIMCSIEMNEISISINKQAFLFGRLAAHDLKELYKYIKPLSEQDKKLFDYKRKSKTLEDTIERRFKDLTNYQNKNYALSYQILVEKVREAEHKLNVGDDYVLTHTVARYAYKLMAYKDEYEIARLYTDGSLKAKIEQVYEGNYKLKFNFIPIIWAARNPATGHFRKAEFGAWVLTIFKLLVKIRGLRGSVFDIFGYKKQRKQERKIAANYREIILGLLDKLNDDNYDIAIKLAKTPEKIRGFGHVKQANLEEVIVYQKKLLEQFDAIIDGIIEK